MHKEDEKRKKLLDRPENFNKIDDPESIIPKEVDGNLFASRFGSSRRNSSLKPRQIAGIINNSFVNDEEDKVIQVIGDLPALHLEHCKL